MEVAKRVEVTFHGGLAPRAAAVAGGRGFDKSRSDAPS